MATCKTLISTSPSSLKPAPSKPKPKPKSLGLGFHGLRASSTAVSGVVSGSSSVDTVDKLLSGRDETNRAMKMERRSDRDGDGRWFPYRDLYKAGAVELGSREIIEVLEPYIKDHRKERIRRAVANRTYSLCLVVEGLTGFGNAAAAFRSAEALGIQSVHVISRVCKKRCKAEI